MLNERNMRKLLTPKQVARAIGVSEASLKRWCDKGLLQTTRTAGGHRRLPLDGVIEFIRQTARPVVQPELLGLPPTSGRTEVVLSRAVPRLREALEAGDAERVRAVVFDLHLAGHTLDVIGDKLVAPALAELGKRWEQGHVEVYQEHRATEVLLRALYELAAALPAPPETAPVALGATLAGDPYQLALTLAELTLRQVGWRAESLGPNHPAATLCAALRHRRPRLLWLSVSHLRSEAEFVSEYQQVFKAASEHRVAVVIGGNALGPQLREQLRYAAYCDTLSHLVTFAQTLHAPPSA